VDGEKRELEKDGSGRIQIVLDQSEHEVILKFGRTWWRWMGEIISVIAVLLTFYFFIFLKSDKGKIY
jgi:hypothetical protein